MKEQERLMLIKHLEELSQKGEDEWKYVEKQCYGLLLENPNDKDIFGIYLDVMKKQGKEVDAQAEYSRFQKISNFLKIWLIIMSIFAAFVIKIFVSIFIKIKMLPLLVGIFAGVLFYNYWRKEIYRKIVRMKFELGYLK